MPLESENCLADHPATTSMETYGLAGALLLLAKPGIIMAEVLTGLAGMLLASPDTAVAKIDYPTLIALVMTAGGAAMMNGILDASTDRLMPRLARRCQALETVGHGRLLIIAMFLMGGGLTLAAITSSPQVMALLAGGCISYLWLYTSWLKRRSPWGVLAGGIPGALPPLIGAAAVNGTITLGPFLFAATIFIWQLPHFWLLALGNRDQYARAQIPVLPLTHGEPLTKALTLTLTLLLIPVTMSLGLLEPLPFASLAVTVGAGIIFSLICARSLYRTGTYKPGFMASIGYLLIITSAICAGRFQ